MAGDRSVRFLDALGGASTSRVLNLYRIAADNEDNPEHAEKPLFRLAHHQHAPSCSSTAPASDETYLFSTPRAVATKIIVPFDQKDLRAGGRSLFVDQRGYIETLRSAGNYSAETLERDLSVLRLLNAVPSLDPFLLREHLRNNEIDVAPCYFAISEGDQERMHRFVTQEMSQPDHAGRRRRQPPAATALVTRLLSNEVDEKLEPLRLTLGLTGKDFREGVFSWRGFLYYKWSMGKFWPDVMGVLREINGIQPHRRHRRPSRRSSWPAPRRSIIEMVRDNGNHVNKALAVYDASFADLVAQPGAQDLPRLPAERALHVPGAGREAGRDLPYRQLLALSLPARQPQHDRCRRAGRHLPGFLQRLWRKAPGRGPDDRPAPW